MGGKIVKGKDYASRMGLDDLVSQDVGSDLELPDQDAKVIRQDVYGASKEAQAIVEKAREEALRIKKHAKEILVRVEEEMERAKEEGFQEGREEGLAQATELIAEATHRKETMFADMEREVIRLVYDIAEKIIGQELTQNEAGIIQLIRQALHASIGQNVIIMVHPQDLEAVKKNHTQLIQALDASKNLQIRADDKVKPHGCRIETEVGTIDAQLETQLAAIRKALAIE